jgi:hypothetical protein
MKALHMVTADPQRTPTLTMFALPDYFFFAGAPNCNSPCVTVPTTPVTSTFAWNHGGIQPEIATTWLGIVGPGVRNNGDDNVWADHVDTRPTMLALVGLKDSYTHDGRVLIDQLYNWAVPISLSAFRDSLRDLGGAYKQLNAPFGSFAMDTLVASTQAIKSGSASDDSTYTTTEGKIADLTTRRDALATKMKTMLDSAAFSGKMINELQANKLVAQANGLLAEAHALANP